MNTGVPDNRFSWGTRQGTFKLGLQGDQIYAYVHDDIEALPEMPQFLYAHSAQAKRWVLPAATA